MSTLKDVFPTPDGGFGPMRMAMPLYILKALAFDNIAVGRNISPEQADEARESIPERNRDLWVVVSSYEGECLTDLQGNRVDYETGDRIDPVDEDV